MTISYALTRFEIVRTFLYALPRSPRMLVTVIGFSAALGIWGLSIEKAITRDLTFRDVITAIEWMIFSFCLLLVWVFIRAKSKRRVLTISAQGIYTEIGSIRADYPWIKVKEVKDVGSYILVVNKTGNAFFIPSRAFDDSAQRAQFLTELNHYRAAP